MGSMEMLQLYFTHKIGMQREHGISEARTIPCCWDCLSELATSNTWPILRQKVSIEQRTRQNWVLNEAFVNSVLLLFHVCNLQLQL